VVPRGGTEHIFHVFSLKLGPAFAGPFFCHLFGLGLTLWILGISRLNFSPSLLMGVKSIQHIERLGQRLEGVSLALEFGRLD
jgi:hypothetical protein